jgi:predicted PurR-regulated permease PerM
VDLPAHPNTPRFAYGGLVAVALVLAALVISPLWRPLLLAAVLASVLWWPHERLAGLLRGRRTLSALALTLATLLFVLVPLTLLGLYLVGEAVQLVEHVRAILRASGPGGLLDALPDRLEGLVRSGLDYLKGGGDDLGARLRTGGTRALLSLGGVLAAIGGAAFHLAIMLIGLFFFLREGRRVVGWVRTAYPLPPEDMTGLLEDFRYIARNVVGATVVTAFVQAVVATIGYRIAGVPAPLVFGALTMFMAFVPALGTPAIGLPLAAFLLLTGHRWQAIFLAAWALLLVGTLDNVLRPILMRGQSSRVDGTVLFFALVGGITVFGPIGLIVGPLAVVLMDAVVRLRRKRIETAG